MSKTQHVVLVGHVLDQLAKIPDETVSTVCTSPPYWSLRKYEADDVIWGGDPECLHGWVLSDKKLTTGNNSAVRGTDDNRGLHQSPKAQGIGGQVQTATGVTCSRCGAWRGQFGLEPTPELYVEHTLQVLRAIRRVLRPDGVVWWNIGDGYAGGGQGTGGKQQYLKDAGSGPMVSRGHGVKAKDLILMPERVALAVQADGWWVRSIIIWCLSGGTWVYAKTQKGEMPMMVRDMARLDPTTVRLWNGKRWTRLIGMSKSQRQGDELKIVLRSGERISCTPAHRFPTRRGLLEASEIEIGDVLLRVRLPEPTQPRDCILDEDAAWFAGLYIAEGSRSYRTIQIAGHRKERERWKRIQRISAKYGGNATRTVKGNEMSIRVYGKILNAIIDELTTGKTSKTKGVAPVVWRYSDAFLTSLLDGYLSGDGHWDVANSRWRLGFSRNYNLERDLRALCARLEYTLTLKPSTVRYDGRDVPTFSGEIRMKRSGHRNERSREEVVAIRKARCREVYDLGVRDGPHLFALASGILTHNSKPNTMPSSASDRPTGSHEYILMLVKNGAKPLYWYNTKSGEMSNVLPRKRGRWEEGVDWRWCDPGEEVGWDEAKGEPIYAKKRRKITLWRGVPYWYDIEAVREKASSANIARISQPTFDRQTGGPKDYATTGVNPSRSARKALENFSRNPGRNLRDVWEFPTAQAAESHFAVFPEELPRRAILASCPREICAKCGTARVRMVDVSPMEIRRTDWGEKAGNRTAPSGTMLKPAESTTIGWTSCDCAEPKYRPGIVLDPFLGIGTTGIVALRLKRRFIGIELSPKYASMARKKLSVFWRKFTVGKSSRTKAKEKAQRKRLKAGVEFDEELLAKD